MSLANECLVSPLNSPPISKHWYGENTHLETWEQDAVTQRVASSTSIADAEQEAF